MAKYSVFKGGIFKLMENLLKEKILFILNDVKTTGLRWKIGKNIEHLEKRKRKGHIPNDFTLNDYERVILSIINDVENDVYLYYLKGFIKDYFVFGNGKWIVIIGDDSIIDTAFQIDTNYFEYLSKEKGYEYLGKIKEVFEDGE